MLSSFVVNEDSAVGNEALNGAGVGANLQSNATISRCAFYNNTAINGGGGIAVQKSSFASVNHSSFASKVQSSSL